MNVKIVIQFLIFLILLVFLFFFIDNTFLSKKQNVVDLSSAKNIRTSETDLKENISNIIKNLNYKSFDGNGNEYVLNADYGEISEENENIIILKKVNGIIKLKNKSYIYINSDFAKYNSESFDTYFYQNVIGTFEDNKIHCDNLDLLIKDSLAVLYNNINFLNYDLTARADRILLNLLNGDVNIKMLDKENKIQIIKKMN